MVKIVLVELLISALRIEKKLDEVLHKLLADAPLSYQFSPMGNDGQVCPLCKNPVSYRPVDVTEPSGHATRIVVRVCNCIPSTNELPTTVQGA